MKFRTEFKPIRSNITLFPDMPVVLTGSCFSQNIAKKMSLHKWESIIPGGTLYNPLSIELAIRMFLNKTNGKEIFENSLFFANGIWNSRMFDSSFSSVNKEYCIQEFINRQNDFNNYLSTGKCLIITFGTSICYFLQTTGIAVGNCHKQPSQEFFRKRLTINEIVENWNNLIEDLNLIFPGINIIFTISPVRHLKDGFEGNSRSKAILQLAVEELCLTHDNCHYFPAFEILNDDLRDYRFYAPDLTHPSDEAIDYIWDIFKSTFIDSEGLKKLDEGERAVKAASHRPKTGALGKELRI